MNKGEKQKSKHISRGQKKKLIEFMTKHPELISCKVTQDLNYKDFQSLWKSIANECNSLPGARKTWRQWRKSWQDIRTNTKKHVLETNGDVPISVMALTPAEQEALGIKNLIPSNMFQAQNESTEFVPLESDVVLDCDLNNPMKSDNHLSEPESSGYVETFNNQMKSDNNLSEPESSGDVETSKYSIVKNEINCKSKRSNEFSYNLDKLAAQEQHKIQLKEDYLNFKKDYLKKKLKLMKEQTEAIKSIAKELLSRE